MLIQPAFQTRVRATIENVWVGCLLPQCSQAWVITSILCGTLSKALEKSRNSTCELDCLSRVLAHSCTVSNNCMCLAWVSAPETMLGWVELAMLIEEVHDLPMHQTFHHNAGKTYRSIYFLGSCLLPFLYTGMTLAQVQSDGNCPDWSDWLKRATSGSESQGAPSLNSLPGI